MVRLLGQRAEKARLGTWTSLSGLCHPGRLDPTLDLTLCQNDRNLTKCWIKSRTKGTKCGFLGQALISVWRKTASDSDWRAFCRESVLGRRSNGGSIPGGRAGFCCFFASGGSHI